MKESLQKKLIVELLKNNSINLNEYPTFEQSISCESWSQQGVPNVCYNAIIKIMSSVSRDKLIKFVSDKDVKNIIKIWNKAQFQEFEFEAPKYMAKLEEIMAKYDEKENKIDFKKNIVDLIGQTQKGITEIIELRGQDANAQHSAILNKLAYIKDVLSAVVEVDSQQAFSYASQLKDTLALIRQRVIQNISFPQSELDTMEKIVGEWRLLKKTSSPYKKGKISLEDEFLSYISYNEKEKSIKEIFGIIQKREVELANKIADQKQEIVNLERSAYDANKQFKNGNITKQRYSEILKQVVATKAKAEDRLKMFERIAESQIAVDFMRKLMDIMEICDLQGISYVSRDELFGCVDLSFLVSNNSNNLSAKESDNMYGQLNNAIANFDMNLAVNNESMRQIRVAMDRLADERNQLIGQVIGGEKVINTNKNGKKIDQEVDELEKLLGLDALENDSDQQTDVDSVDDLFEKLSSKNE